MAVSAGLLMYRRKRGVLEVLLVHPGGPFYKNKDLGSWSLPKGLVDENEASCEAARREFREETGLQAPATGLIDLGEVRQKSGKRVRAWAFEGDCDPVSLVSNTFSLEWPPRSGRRQDFPEIDRAAFFDAQVARRRLNPAQVAFLERLEAHLSGTTARDSSEVDAQTEP